MIKKIAQNDADLHHYQCDIVPYPNYLPAMETQLLALKLGWIGMLLGVISGAIMGLLFHRENWLGGYAAHARRFVRLGHISFFGIGLLMLFYGLSFMPMGVSPGHAKIGVYGLAVALFGMPSVCGLTAWKKPFRHLFFIPVLGAATGICIILFFSN